jgi:hypothetical protein
MLPLGYKNVLRSYLGYVPGVLLGINPINALMKDYFISVGGHVANR